MNSGCESEAAFFMIIGMPYLLKTEPGAYSFADLEHDKETVWNGVTNPVAVKNLQAMTVGDDLVIYHTGEERAAVGTAKVVSVAMEGKTPVVKIQAGKALKATRTLADMKGHALFADSPIAKQGRLSVVPLTKKQFDWIVGA